MKINYFQKETILFLILILRLSSSQSEKKRENHFYNFLQIENSKELDQDSQSIKGYINLDGQIYNTICDCKSSNQEEPTALAQCDPSKLELQQNKKGNGASYDDVRKMIGHPHELTYVNVAQSHFECLDGRNPKGILGTPGGDAGEFLLALHVYEGLLGQNRKLSQEAVESYLTQYLKTMKQNKFYMCTDDEALSHLEKDSGVTMNNEILQNPQEGMRKELLEYLMKPSNNGCPHIKKMLKSPEYYSIRLELVQNFLQAFYNILWNKENPLREKLIIESMVGDTQGQAFLEVRSNEACNNASIAALIKPKGKNLSIFVNHLDAASIRRAQLSKFFANNVNGHTEPIDSQTMHGRMNKHGILFLEVTGYYIAKNLPFYTMVLH